MKLRNKTTGEIKEYTHTMTSYHVPIKGGYEIFTPWYPEEWEELEDVKEPLIKDGKVCKAVRAWAEANDKRVFEVQVCYQSYGDGSWSLRDTTHEEDCGLAFIGEIPEGLNLGSRYTITELCGEEEE